ncbi:MAG: OsmC family protein [Alphaproteobacteria bacterium]|uniref:OsmC family protein n=1 Tax=Candidatus Nitrobium versatile TaxID=2884831 RepID=A0A953JBZ7_9BACT|nr:OsmC family protein [Candidatus Nitrobium versatile]
MQAKVKWVDGMQFVGESDSGHAIVMDADKDAGGNNTGMRPTELLLIGLGGCTGMDVASVLRKKRQLLSGVETNIKGQKAQDYPQKFTEIEIEFVVTGKDLSEEAVKRAVELSMTKYCSVKATLEGTAKVSYRYRIVQE